MPKSWLELQKAVIGHKNFMHLSRSDQERCRRLCDKKRWSQADADVMTEFKIRLNRMKPGKKKMFMPSVATDYPEMEHSDGMVDVDTLYLGEDE